MKVVATNKELGYKYEIISKLICGIELKGTEVKSLREGKATLKEGFVLIRGGELILKNVYIAHYDKGNINNVNELRDRKLLAHKEEIISLSQKIKQNGFTIIPHVIGFEKQYAKVEIALCRGKKLYDKRDDIKKKEAIKRINQALRSSEKNI